MKLLATTEEIKKCQAATTKLELKMDTLFLSKDEYIERLMYHN